MALVTANLRLSLKNILFTTDFSSASDAALPYAMALARWYGARIVAAHCVPPEPMLGVPMDPLPGNTDFEWEGAQKKMSSFLASDPLRGVEHQTILQQGGLWDVLSRIIEQHDIDMVVMGSHGREGLKKLVLGSAAEQIFRRAPCPVLTVGPHAVRRAEGFENWRCIVFATDFSPGSLHALPYALSLAEENQANLVLLHLISMVPVQQHDEVKERACQRLKALVPIDAAAWCEPEYLVRFEFPADGILQVAEERNADLVVMGVHQTGSPRFSAHVPLTVASEIVCRAHCPVLTVKG